MEAHIQQWGNSLALRIPIQIARELKLHKGSMVTLEIEEDRIVILAPKYKLDSMLSEITDKNRHCENLDDRPRGNEVW